MKISKVNSKGFSARNSGVSCQDLLLSWRAIYQAALASEPMAELIDQHVSLFPRLSQKGVKQRVLSVVHGSTDTEIVQYLSGIQNMIHLGAVKV